MPLITVYFPGPRKAIIDQCNKDFFIGIGAVETQAEAETPQGAMPDPDPIELEPDKGFGRPGDLKWHTLQINDMWDKHEISEYCAEVTGFVCDKRLGLKKCRNQAIEIIREHLENDKNS